MGERKKRKGRGEKKRNRIIWSRDQQVASGNSAYLDVS